MTDIGWRFINFKTDDGDVIIAIDDIRAVRPVPGKIPRASIAFKGCEDLCGEIEVRGTIEQIWDKLLYYQGVRSKWPTTQTPGAELL